MGRSWINFPSKSWVRTGSSSTNIIPPCSIFAAGKGPGSLLGLGRLWVFLPLTPKGLFGRRIFSQNRRNFSILRIFFLVCCSGAKSAGLLLSCVCSATPLWRLTLALLQDSCRFQTADFGSNIHIIDHCHIHRTFCKVIHCLRNRSFSGGKALHLFIITGIGHLQ